MSTELEQVRIIHDFQLSFQRKRRIIAVSHGIGADEAGENLSYPEEAILLLLKDEPDKNVRELALAINLERSWVSRITTSLEERKLLKSVVPPNDKRSRNFSLTAKALQTLKVLDSKLNLITEESLQALNKKEQSEFCQLLEKLADGLGAAPIASQENRHPVDIELLRISRASGVLGESVFETELNITRLQVLVVLNQFTTAVQMVDLSRYLPFDLSTVSRVISDFEAKGLVEKNQSKEDKRSYAIMISPMGRKKLDSYYAMVLPKIVLALKDFSADEVKSFAFLFEKLTADQAPQETGTKEGQFELRALLEVPENYKKFSVCNDDSVQRIGIFEQGICKGFSEIKRKKGNNKIESFTLRSEDISESELLCFIQSAIKK